MSTLIVHVKNYPNSAVVAGSDFQQLINKTHTMIEARYYSIDVNKLVKIVSADVQYALTTARLMPFGKLQGMYIIQIKPIATLASTTPSVSVAATTTSPVVVKQSRGRKAFGRLAYSEKAYMKQCNKAQRLEKKIALLTNGSKSSRMFVSKTAYMKQMHKAHRLARQLSSCKCR